jgi:Flp pilus assembly protein TadG
MAFLIFEFCMAIYTYSVLGNAAREGVRYAIVHGTDNSSCSGPSSGCADSGGNNVTAVVNSVLVTISYPYVSYLALPGFNSPQMQIKAEGRIVF